VDPNSGGGGVHAVTSTTFVPAEVTSFSIAETQFDAVTSRVEETTPAAATNGDAGNKVVGIAGNEDDDEEDEDDSDDDGRVETYEC